MISLGETAVIRKRVLFTSDLREARFNPLGKVKKIGFPFWLAVRSVNRVIAFENADPLYSLHISTTDSDELKY